jgi:hypothetical protein
MSSDGRGDQNSGHRRPYYRKVSGLSGLIPSGNSIPLRGGGPIWRKMVCVPARAESEPNRRINLTPRPTLLQWACCYNMCLVVYSPLAVLYSYLSTASFRHGESFIPGLRMQRAIRRPILRIIEPLFHCDIPVRRLHEGADESGATLSVVRGTDSAEWQSELADVKPGRGHRKNDSRGSMPI